MVIGQESIEQPAHRRRRKEHRAFRRANIVTAAETLFRERGVDSTSMADIASLAETGVGTLYGYFESKEDLLREILRRLSQASIEQCFSVTTPATDHEERILAALRVYGGFLEDNRQLLRTAFVSGIRNDLASEIVQPMFVALCGFFQAGIATGAIRPLPVETTVRTLLSSHMMGLLGLGAWAGSGDETATRADLESIAAALLRPG